MEEARGGGGSRRVEEHLGKKDELRPGRKKRTNRTRQTAAFRANASISWVARFRLSKRSSSCGGRSSLESRMRSC